MSLKGVLLLLSTGAFTVTGQILMKVGMTISGHLSFKDSITSPYILAGVLCYISGFLVWLNVLKILPLSIAYPFSSITYVLIIFGSAFFLGEPITLFKIIGIVCIVTGVVFISQG